MTHFEHVPLHPRPRGALEASRPAPLERPAATGGTPVYDRVNPTASGARRTTGLARLWNQPNAFRRAVSAAEGVLGHPASSGRSSPTPPPRVPFPTTQTDGTFATSPGQGDREVGDGVDGRGSSEDMTYCVVPRDLTRKVAEALARMYADEPTIEVIVERRDGDRRMTAERRSGQRGARSRIVERRHVRNADGRRVAERRGVLVPSFGQMPLPRVARRYEDRIAFCGLIGPSPTWVEEVESTRLALAHQTGDTRAFEALYMKWFDRTLTFSKVMHGNQEQAEEALQLAFVAAFGDLKDFQPSAMSFRTWLARHALGQAPPSMVEADHDEGDARLLERWAGPPDMQALRWLQDSEILVLIGRLPSPQREVVALHYVFAMSPGQIAELLACTADEVTDLHDRALRFMSGCVTSLSRRPGYSGRHPMRARPRNGVVTLSRKMALAA